MKATTSMLLVEIIDKMVNCTAAERADLTGEVYGDYMDGIEPIVINTGTDLGGVIFIMKLPRYLFFLPQVTNSTIP